MKISRRTMMWSLANMVFVGSATAQFGWRRNKQEPLTDSQINGGLKEALSVGIDKTVQLTGKKDGYFLNDAIKIGVPDKLRIAEKGLRMFGYGDQVDEFVLSMNRAAEAAAPLAKDIFLDAIKGLTFADVREIYTGGDTAATEYLKRSTSDELTTAFRPIVAEKMDEYQVTHNLNQMLDRYKAVPMAENLQIMDVEGYTVKGALAGLFHVLGEQEQKIRQFPAARTTDLLKEVFGRSQEVEPKKEGKGIGSWLKSLGKKE